MKASQFIFNFYNDVVNNNNAILFVGCFTFLDDGIRKRKIDILKECTT